MLCVDVFKKEYLEQHDERFTERRAEKGSLMPGCEHHRGLAELAVFFAWRKSKVMCHTKK